jgi:hypothetical protein
MAALRRMELQFTRLESEVQAATLSVKAPLRAKRPVAQAAGVAFPGRLIIPVVTERSQEDHVWVTRAGATRPKMIAGTVGRIKGEPHRDAGLAEQGAPNRRTA